MFEFLKGLGGVYPDYDSIRVNTQGWQQVESPQAKAGPLWKTQDGDGVGLEILRRRPKLPQSMDLYGYRNLFLQTMQSSGGIPVELGSLEVSQCPAIRFLYKIPQAAGGMAYCGTLTLPFRRFSFLFEVHCGDHGSSEARDASLAERGVTLAERKAREWPPAPKTPQADMAQFDAEFPASPVARLRRILTRIADSAVIEARIACLPTCELPG